MNKLLDKTNQRGKFFSISLNSLSIKLGCSLDFGSDNKLGMHCKQYATTSAIESSSSKFLPNNCQIDPHPIECYNSALRQKFSALLNYPVHLCLGCSSWEVQNPSCTYLLLLLPPKSSSAALLEPLPVAWYKLLTSNQKQITKMLMLERTVESVATEWKGKLLLSTRSRIEYKAVPGVPIPVEDCGHN